MEIEARSFATCAVVKGGGRIALGLVTMAAPLLLRNSLKDKHCDEAVPLYKRQVEAASRRVAVRLPLPN